MGYKPETSPACRLQSQQDPEQGCLAAAGRTHQAVGLPGFQGKVQIFENVQIPVGFGQMVCDQSERFHTVLLKYSVYSSQKYFPMLLLSFSICPSPRRSSFSNSELTRMITIVQANRSAVAR